jgi:hypothetical protein
MSVLSNSTHFNISNNTGKFLELTVSADQNSSFRIHHTSDNIMEMPRNPIEHASYMSWLVDSVSTYTRGSSMQMVKINLHVKETVQCEIHCTGALEFETRIKDRNSKDHNYGSMVIPPETQGCELHVIYSEIRGLGYTSKGDVAIGLGDLTSHSVIVSTNLKTMDGHTIEVHDNIPSMCKSVI